MPCVTTKLSAVASTTKSITPAVDFKTQWASHCAASTQRFLEESPLWTEAPVYHTPIVDLDVLIEDVLRASPAPLSAALATLTLINWITESGSCPIASSSPHHLFLATYIVFTQGLCEVDAADYANWSFATTAMVDWAEIEEAKVETAQFLETVRTIQWEIIKVLLESDAAIEELFDLECEQAYDDSNDSESFDIMEEGLVMKGFITFDQSDIADYQIVRDIDFDDESDPKNVCTSIITQGKTKMQDISELEMEISPSLVKFFEDNWPSS